MSADLRWHWKHQLASLLDPTMEMISGPYGDGSACSTSDTGMFCRRLFDAKAPPHTKCEHINDLETEPWGLSCLDLQIQFSGLSSGATCYQVMDCGARMLNSIIISSSWMFNPHRNGLPSAWGSMSRLKSTVDFPKVLDIMAVFPVLFLWTDHWILHLSGTCCVNNGVLLPLLCLRQISL